MKKFVFAVALVIALSTAGTAHAASFFDGSDWWMAADQWGYERDGESVTGLDSGLDSPERLEFSADGLGLGMATYRSKWYFIADQDADVSVDFHFDPDVFGGTGGGIMVGFGPLDNMIDDGVQMWVAGNDQSLGYEFAIGDVKDANMTRTYTDGTLTAQFDHTAKTLTMQSDEAGISHIFYLSALADTDTIGMVIGAGSSTGFTYGYPEAYFSNLQITGHVAPEPVSSALFLLGSAVLGLKRLRKRAA